MSAYILDKLYQILLSRKGEDVDQSYVANLYQKGTEKICSKVIEEAGEVIVEAVKGDQKALAAESADLIFHLMVLWTDQGVVPDDVFRILEQRFGVGGLEEKASRGD